MRVVVDEKVREHVQRRGGDVWVWLDPHRGVVGSHIYLETHTEPPGTSRETKFTRSSRRPHRFRRLEADGITVHYDWGHREPPGELLIEVKGIAHKRLEAYWDGCIFVDDARNVP
jgi:hypothetical protein